MLLVEEKVKFTSKDVYQKICLYSEENHKKITDFE